jgi:hypothetical protein
MTDILNKTIVLVLNRNWQAINPAGAGHAAGRVLPDGYKRGHGPRHRRRNHIRPVTWEEWITLPIREGDHAVHTARKAIRVPTVISMSPFVRTVARDARISGFWLTTKRQGSLATAEGAAIAAPSFIFAGGTASSPEPRAHSRSAPKSAVPSVPWAPPAA